MRNVTIVESNVEPNKEHLWFYKGELKWFSPNGWEGVNKSSPTISPTSTKPLIAYIIFKSDAASNAVINGERIPMNTPKAVIIDYYYSLTALTVPGRKFIGFYENEVKISSAEIIRYHVLPGVHNIELRYKRENEDLDSTTTSTPEPDPSATTTSTTSTSTIYLKNSIRFTNKTNADIGVAGAMSNNGSTISPPILPNQTHLLGQVHDDFELYAYYNQVQFNSLNIKAFKDGVLVLEEVPYVFNSNTNSYTISFKNLVDKEVTDVIINGDIPAQPTTTTTTTTSTTTSSTPGPSPDTTTTTSTRPPNGSGRKIIVQPYYGVTGRLSTLMTSKDKLSDIMDMEEKFYPVDTYEYMYYSTSGRYLAVASSNTTENTIVAEITVAADNLNPHTLYPIETSVNGDTGYKFFLFDLSKSPQLESKYDMYAAYVNLCGYTPTTISTIAPFIDGNIPPFADEK